MLRTSARGQQVPNTFCTLFWDRRSVLIFGSVKACHKSSSSERTSGSGTLSPVITRRYTLAVSQRAALRRRRRQRATSGCAALPSLERWTTSFNSNVQTERRREIGNHQCPSQRMMQFQRRKMTGVTDAGMSCTHAQTALTCKKLSRSPRRMPQRLPNVFLGKERIQF